MKSVPIGGIRHAGFVLAMVLAASAAPAGVKRWTSNGPNAPSVANLTISPGNPSVLYLAAGTNFFKSTDGGITWTVLPNPNPIQVGGWASAIAIDPHSPSTVYAIDGGIYRSDDGGATWIERDQGFSNFGILTLASNSSNPATLYASSDGIYKSADRGTTWTKTATQVQLGVRYGGSVGAVFCHPKSASTVYATAYSDQDSGAELWQSTDSGSTWSRLNLASGQVNFRYNVFSVFGDPRDADTTYAIADNGLFKTSDGGKTWTNRYNGPLGASSTLVIDPANSSRVYLSTSGSIYAGFHEPQSGFFLSSDGGASWSPLGKGLPQAGISSMVIDPGGASLYAGTGAGVFKSTDFGTNWNGLAFIPTGSYVGALTTVPGQPNVLFAGTDHGLFRSNDRGRSWQESGLSGFSVGTTVIDPQTPSLMYAAAGSAVMKSVDSGNSWSPASNGISAFPQQGLGVYTIAIDPKTPTTLYTFEFTSFELYKTTDGAANWIPSALKEDIYALTVDPVDPTVIYAGRFGAADYGHDVLVKSTDGGKFWGASQNGLPYPGSVNAIAIDPQNHSILYAGTGKGVFKSTDSAATWKVTGLGPNPLGVSALAIDSAHPNTVYAAGYQSVYRTTDGGVTWTTLNSGLDNLSVTSLAIDLTGRFLFAGTSGGGVFNYELAAGPIDLTVGSDEATRLLFVEALDSSLSVERVDFAGTISKIGPFGPYSGWSAVATATASDSLTRVLWTDGDGSAELWLVAQAGVAFSFRYPGIAGLTAADVTAVGSSTHVLWTGADGKAAIQTIDASGSVTKTLSLGPYAGWQATAISDGPDGLTRILWNNVNGTAGISVVSSEGSLATTRYGPAAGWTALDVAVGGDGLTRVLWSSLDGRITLGILEASGKLFRYGEILNSPAGLAPIRVASGPDGSSRILLTGDGGASRLWIMTAAGERQREIVVSSGPQLDISGVWSGPFQTNDSADCHSDPAANATFSQNGLDVTGTITTIANTCGFGGDFQGTLSGNSLTGTLTRVGFGQASVTGSVSVTEILLKVSNMFGNGNREIPGGTLIFSGNRDSQKAESRDAIRR